MDTLAAFVTELGPPERIRVGQLPIPNLGPTDVQVSTQALAVNHVDTLVRSGDYPTTTPFPFIIGRDLVGTITTTGPGAAGFTTGDTVWCNSLGHDGRQGSFAHDVIVTAERLYHLPDDVDPIEAVAVLHTAGTACLGLFRKARLGPADTVIVAGGAGGVGSAAVQLAAVAGAHVIATAASEDAQWCQANGADAVIDYRDPHQITQLADAAPHGADVYWDTSGHQDLEAIGPLLAHGARVILTAAGDATAVLPAQWYYTHDISVHPFAISNASVSDLQAAAKVINTHLRSGILRPRIGATIPLQNAAEAHRQQQAGTTGRIVVVP